MLGHLDSLLPAPDLAPNTPQHCHSQPCAGQDAALVQPAQGDAPIFGLSSCLQRDVPYISRITEIECCKSPYTSSSFPRDHNSWSMGGPRPV